MLGGSASWSEAFCQALAPRPRLSVSEWADRHRVLSGKAASEPGPWRTERTPYLREILDALSADSDAEEVVVWFGTQMGKSEAVLNWVGYGIDHNPGPLLLVQPTLDLAKRFSKQRVAALIGSTPVLRGRVLPARARDSGNTLLEKEFDGGILIITGANSAAGLRSMPARDLLFDEIDAYPLSIDDEGDPISLAEKRQDTFARRKRLKTSTCTIKGESRIERAFEASDRRRYHVPCPHCGHFQVLRWANLKWAEGDPDSARYGCEECGALIEETAKTEMLARGKWRAEVPAARVRGYWINSLYSPLGWLSWPAIVREFLDAKAADDAGDPTLLQVWTNTRLAQTWELKGSTVEHGDVQRRAEPYGLRTLPRGVLVLTVAVDVQGDRLEYMIVGWGRGEECWIVDYGRLDGDPADDVVWQRLDDEVLKPQLANGFGIKMRISACAVDHGGHHALKVETFTRARAGRHVLAVKGQSQADKPILGKPSERDTTWRGKKLKAGARVWPVGVSLAKATLYRRLELTRPGPGYIHTSHELDDAFYTGLTAEQLVTRYVAGRARSEWTIKKGVRNEPLDLWVYNYAAFAYLGGVRWKEGDWDRLADIFEPPLFAPPSLLASLAPAQPPDVVADERATADAQAAPAPIARPVSAAPARRPRGFVKGWKR